MDKITPISIIVEKARNGEIDPDDVNIEKLIEEFRLQIDTFTKVYELFMYASMFLDAITILMRLKLGKLLDTNLDNKKERKIKLKEVVEALQEIESDDNLDWLYTYQTKIGRKAGIKSKSYVKTIEKFQVNLHKAFNVQEYVNKIKEMQFTDFKIFKDWLYTLERQEQVRFFIAFLFIYQDMNDIV